MSFNRSHMRFLSDRHSALHQRHSRGILCSLPTIFMMSVDGGSKFDQSGFGTDFQDWQSLMTSAGGASILSL